ncbi:MAG: OB-fold domain-containing protein [Acidimicrobiales bacterium]|nr:OB-fold domain-containing protein [Acidimicrobiales bacterium]
MAKQVPIVDYLVLGDPPRLEVSTCTACGAGFFDRRIRCGRCGGRDFERRVVPATGIVRTFTIVHRAAPGTPTPYVSAVVELDDGTRVKANLLGVEPDPKAITLGMKVELATFVAETDDEGTEAVAFGFRPLNGGKGFSDA